MNCLRQRRRAVRWIFAALCNQIRRMSHGGCTSLDEVTPGPFGGCWTMALMETCRTMPARRQLRSLEEKRSAGC